MRALLENQINAIEQLTTLKVGALFMQPGTGKTGAAFNLINGIDDVDLVVWLTPFQTQNNLKSEIDKWGRFDNLVIIGIETLSSSNKAYLNLRQRIEQHKAVIVVDESLKIKNTSAIRTKRIIELGKLCEYRLILNGTPITRSLLDLWAQMEFLSPKILGMHESRFKNIFCEYTTVKKRIGNVVITKEFITKYHNVDYLYSIIKPYIYECDLNLLVGKQYHDYCYTLSEELQNEYQYLKDHYLNNEKLLMLNNNFFLELTQKMQNAYCCAPEKFGIVDRLLRANDPNKVLIYCKYQKSNKAVKERYPSVLTMSYGKHAYGLNLQDKNVIIFFDKTWDYAQRLQTEQRIYREGQQNDCIYYDLTGNIGLEKLINKNIDKKQSLVEYFKSHSMEDVKNQL